MTPPIETPRKLEEEQNETSYSNTVTVVEPPTNPNKRPPNIKMKRSIRRLYERDREAIYNARTR